MEYCEACAMGMVERIHIGNKIKTICKYKESTGKPCPYQQTLRLSWEREIRDLCLTNGQVEKTGKIEYEKGNVIRFPLERVKPSTIENKLTLVISFNRTEKGISSPEDPSAA